ncbi:MAG: mandelate racemase/muconate lactonizing enzyme family protein [Thermodesulfobacteriota bacterium]
MKVKTIKIRHYARSFTFEFHSTQTFRRKANSIILELKFDNGISGWGESIPMKYITGETSPTVIEAIREYFSPVLLSRSIFEPDDIEALLGELEEACLKNHKPYYNTALGAVDIALFDALGKQQDVPVINLFPPIVRDKALYSISIPFLPLQKIQDLFYRLPEKKVREIKVLVGKNEQENVERVSFVRALFGDSVDIRLENNGIWTLDQAIANLERIKKFNISAVEQPLAKHDIQGLHNLRKASGIPIIADESICSLTDAEHLIEQGACDIMNIKISKCGGLLKSKRIAQLAQSHNVSCQMGAHVGETEILRSAGKAFALTTPNLRFFEGASFLLFEDAWKKASFEITKEDALTGIGLGIKPSILQSILNHCSGPV